MECLSLVLFTAYNDSGLPSSHLHGLKKKKQPFPQKASRQTQTWGSIIDLTLHTKDALVLLLVRLVPRAGASKKLQPAVYQRRCPSRVLFPNPALPPPFNGISTYSKAGPISKHLNFAVCFPTKSCNVIYSGRNFFFFECLYVWQCAELVKGLMFLLQGIRSPRWQDSPLRPRPPQGEPAHCPPPLVSQVGAVGLLQDKEVCFVFPFKPWFSFPLNLVREKCLYFSKSLWSLLELGVFTFFFKTFMSECG